MVSKIIKLTLAIAGAYMMISTISLADMGTISVKTAAIKVVIGIALFAIAGLIGLVQRAMEEERKWKVTREKSWYNSCSCYRPQGTTRVWKYCSMNGEENSNSKSEPNTQMGMRGSSQLRVCHPGKSYGR